VNDFYEVGYDTKAKWDKILATSTVVGEIESKKVSRFIMLDRHLECYDTKYNKYQKTDSVSATM
jgi:ribosomal protein S17